MRRSWLLEALFIAIAISFVAQLVTQQQPLEKLALNQPISAKYLRLIDAQTLLVEVDNQRQLCLVLNGINTPAINEAGYTRSLLGLLNLVEGQFLGELEVVLDRKINNRLWLGSIYNQQQEIWGNLQLVYLGIAWPAIYFTLDTNKRQVYQRNARLGQQEAKSLALGHWAGIHIKELPSSPKNNYYDQLITSGHSNQLCWSEEK